MLKKIITSGLLLALGFAVALLISEGTVRLFSPQPETPRWFAEDARYVYALKRNFHQQYRFSGSDFVMDVHTNAFGLRDREWDPDGASACVRVLLLGDSFIFGYGVNVEDRFDTRLARLLEGKEDIYYLINAGVPGWGTVQETRFARDHFKTFLPNILVLSFCGNDPSDDAQFMNGEMVFKEDGVVGFPGKTWLRNHSHLYRFVLRHTTALRRVALRRAEQQEGEAVHMDAQSAAVLEAEMWGRTLETIRDFHRSFLAFNPAGRLILLATNPEDTEIGTRLASLDDGHTLRYLDWHDVVMRIPPEERTLPFDRHWSVAVHAAVAEALARFIEDVETNP